jgi:CubicO group peptidase (beta-lactamase class C family)
MIIRNWRLPAIAAGALAVALAPAALAQKPISDPPVASILTWTQKQQLERYPAIEKVYAIDTIKKGDKVSPLPAAATQIDPKITFNKRSSTVDAFMKDNRITGLIAIKDGEVVLEKYALGRKPEDRWTSFSVAKSMTSILIGAAIKDGWINNVHEPVTRYLPELKGSAYDGVSIRQLISMQTGVKWDENYASQQSDVARASRARFTGGHPIENNPLLQYMAKLPKKAEPGVEWVYKTGETDLAGMVLVRALAGKSLAQYASEKIWAPYGMEQDGIWMQDKAGLDRGGCCMSMTLRDYGRIGQFMLGGGRIAGKDILAPGWVEESTKNHAPPKSRERGESYGYFWWPMEDGYRAVGIFGQGIYVYPEENLVIAINSAMPKATDRVQSQKIAALVSAVRAAANGGPAGEGRIPRG